MRRRIPTVLNAMQAASAANEILETAIEAPVKSTEEKWEERMREQRRAWREQDTRHYRDEERERLRDNYSDDTWNAYAWSLRRKRWIFLGTRPVRRGRRKPMTMNRLFAGIRQRFGIPKHICIKLISQLDDELRRRRGDLFLPPQHMHGRNRIVS